MSWMLWAQIAGLMVVAGIVGRHVLEAPRRTMALTGVVPIPVPGQGDE